MTGPFKLAPLPWDEAALEPAISSRTISFHYHKHHQTYVDTLNKLVEKTKFADMKLEKIVQATAELGRRQGKEDLQQCRPGVESRFLLAQPVARQDRAVGQTGQRHRARFRLDRPTLIAELAEAGKTQFGSGWAWLVSKDGKLSVTKTANADDADGQGRQLPSHRRCLGACLLSGLSECAAQISGSACWARFSTGIMRRKIWRARTKRCAPPPSDRRANMIELRRQWLSAGRFEADTGVDVYVRNGHRYTR